MPNIEFRIVDDYSLVADFEKNVIAYVPKEEHMFFAPRSEQWYLDNMRDGDYVVGAFDGEKMIGKGIVMQLLSHEMDTESLRQFAANFGPNLKAADFCGDFVDPNYAGQSIQRKMIDYRAQVMADKGLPYMIAVTLPQNFKSIMSYMRAGFTIEGTGISDAEGNPDLYFLCKKLNGSLFDVSEEFAQSIDIEAYDEKDVVEKLQQGWRGVELRKATTSRASPVLTLVK